MRNAMTSEKAAVFSIEREALLTRLQHELDTLAAQKRISEAVGVNRAMQIVNRMDVHIIPQTEWEEGKR